MQRLLSLKSLSNSSKRLQVSTFLQLNASQSSIFFTSINSNHLSISSLFQPHPISNIYKSFRSWRDPNICFRIYSWIFKTPILTRHTFSNTRLAIHGRRFFGWGIQSILRQKYQFGQWSYLNGYSRRLRMPTTEGIVWSLIAANVVVFLLWRNADPMFMVKNFTISLNNITNGRIHTLITSAFSQMETGHLLSNMFGLYFFGRNIGLLFGPEYLLKLYIAGALCGSIFFVVHKAISSSEDAKYVRGLGASGAVNAIILLDIFLFPRAVHYINFIIPVPAILLGAVLIGKDILDMMKPGSHISGEAHLGGAVVAALAWARIRKGWF